MRTLKKAGWAMLVALSLSGALASQSAQAWGYVGLTVGFAPPAIPVTVQPPCPGEGFLWTPGYWAYDPIRGYYWVAGAWVVAPAVGLLWTPGYWAWESLGYRWHAGYWGPRVGFYGGVNYGFGYFGAGYKGGYWENGHFAYNRAVNNIDPGRVGHWYGREVAMARAGAGSGWTAAAAHGASAPAFHGSGNAAAWGPAAYHGGAMRGTAHANAAAGRPPALHASAGRSWGGGRFHG